MWWGVWWGVWWGRGGGLPTPPQAKIREVFRLARAAAPAIVFLDELDAMVGRRDLEGCGDGGGGSGDVVGARVLSTLLNELDGVEEARGVLLVGATNRPDAVDPALMRPVRPLRALRTARRRPSAWQPPRPAHHFTTPQGRLDHVVEVGLPDAVALEAILMVRAAWGLASRGALSLTTALPPDPTQPHTLRSTPEAWRFRAPCQWRSWPQRQRDCLEPRWKLRVAKCARGWEGGGSEAGRAVRRAVDHPFLSRQRWRRFEGRSTLLPCPERPWRAVCGACVA